LYCQPSFYNVVVLHVCVSTSQLVMHETYTDAFAGVQNALRDKLAVSWGLLPELRRRCIVTQPQVDDIMVYLYS